MMTARGGKGAKDGKGAQQPKKGGKPGKGGKQQQQGGKPERKAAASGEVKMWIADDDVDFSSVRVCRPRLRVLMSFCPWRSQKDAVRAVTTTDPSR